MLCNELTINNLIIRLTNRVGIIRALECATRSTVGKQRARWELGDLGQLSDLDLEQFRREHPVATAGRYCSDHFRVVFFLAVWPFRHSEPCSSHHFFLCCACAHLAQLSLQKI